MTDTGPVVKLQVSFSRSPWRLAPAWSVLAGALASGAPLAEASTLVRLVVAIALADIAWGVLRQYAVATRAEPISRIPAHLPYAVARAPLTRALGALSVSRVPEPGWQGALGGLALTFGLSAYLGWQTVLISVLAGIMIGLVWRVRRQGETPALSNAVLDVGLPGLLGVSLSGLRPESLSAQIWAFIAVCLVAQWALLRLASGSRAQFLGLGLWSAAMIAALILRFQFR